MSDAVVLSGLAGPDPSGRLLALERLALSAAPLGVETVAAVVACLGTPNKSVQRLAADLLSRVEAEMHGRVVALLRSALGSSDADLRWGAAYALGRIGLVEPAMIAPLLEVLGLQDGDFRWAAAELLIMCARVHPDAVVTALLAAVSDREAERRKMALYVLREVAPAHRAVQLAAIQGLADPVVGVRFAALAVLRRIDPVPPEACALVLRLVSEDSDAGLRRAALCALADVGRGVNAVGVALADAATSGDPGMRRAALVARRRWDSWPARSGRGSE